MQEPERFKIVFEKLAEAESEMLTEKNIPLPMDEQIQGEASPEEIEAIDVLRRIVLEVTKPDPVLYTTT